jgi:hypothetical protein
MTHKYINLPKRLSSVEYENALSQILDIVSQFDGVSSVYKYGSLKAPGFSDLDMILILDSDEVNSRLNQSLSNFKISSPVSGICEGKFFKLFSCNLFESIFTLGDINLVNLYGKNITHKKINDKHLNFYKLCNCIDWLMERLLTLHRHRDREQINVVKLVGDMYSFAHSIKNTAILTGRISHYSEYLILLEDLRSTWFNKNEKDSLGFLIELHSKSFEIGYSAITDLVDYLNMENLLIEDISLNQTVAEIKRNIGFKYLSYNEYLNIHNKFKYSDGILITPLIFLSYYKLVNPAQTNLSRLIKSNYRLENIHYDLKSISKNFNFCNIVKSRFDYCSRIYDFIESNNLHKSFLYRYGHLAKI